MATLHTVICVALLGLAAVSAQYGYGSYSSSYRAPQRGYSAPQPSYGYGSPQPGGQYSTPQARQGVRSSISTFNPNFVPQSGGITPITGLFQRLRTGHGGGRFRGTGQGGGRFHGTGQGGGRFYYSWEHPKHSDGQYTWSQAHQQCRQLGMRLVSLDSPDKEQEINRRLRSSVPWYWTSGRRQHPGGPFSWGNGKPVCYQGQGCYQNWSHTGGSGRPQPDDREGDENYVAVLINFYGDGIVWHDIANHHRKHFVCEKELGQYA